MDFIKNVLLKDFLGLWALFLLRIVTAPAVVMESTLKSLQAYVLRKRFLHQYHLEHYVVYNDFTNEHVIRNMVLAQDGTKTLFYLHSRHHSDLFAPAEVKDQYCHTIYSYLFYDNLAVWSNNIESMMRPNRIKRFLGLGCLWSEHIKEIEAQADFTEL